VNVWARERKNVVGKRILIRKKYQKTGTRRKGMYKEGKLIGKRGQYKVIGKKNQDRSQQKRIRKGVKNKESVNIDQEKGIQ